MAAPDVIFGAEDETFHSFVLRGGGEEANLKASKNCLSDWNTRDPTRLMVLVQQLRFGIFPPFFGGGGGFGS